MGSLRWILQIGFYFLMLSHWSISVSGCGYPGAPAHSTLTFSSQDLAPGVVATYACERGFELLGPSRRICQDDGKWIPEGIPFCVLNVAAGKAPMQSSVAGNGVPQKAVDGSAANFFNPSTCTLTQPERAPWWYVNLLEPYMVQLVRLDFGRPCCGEDQLANIVVRVGNNRPDLGVNPVCNKFVGIIEEGKPLFLPCNPPIAGAFVSVQLEGPPGNALSICEAFVYTDQALPIERCPQFRDQPPGSTATYNSKCYIFYNQQMLRFDEARQFCASRGGSLVDDSNPALQGFLSWEMWRRHRSDPSAQYWLGVVRDTKDANNWKWLNGKDVTVSFWNLPAGRGSCARFDGSKGWLWSDTNCNDAHNFICQHGPRGCGRPEQPPNSTLLATSLEVGARIEHRCDPGHVIIGPDQRTCLPNGFYSEFPPVCKFLECGLPAQVPNGDYMLLNGTRSYQSYVRYSCQESHVMVGRQDLICDMDQKWDGPPPRCEPLLCPDPPSISNGFYEILDEKENAYRIHYHCHQEFQLVGQPVLNCIEGGYDQPPPICRELQTPPPPTLPPALPPPVSDISPVPVTRRVPPSQPPTVLPITTPTTTIAEDVYDDINPQQYDDQVYGDEFPLIPLPPQPTPSPSPPIPPQKPQKPIIPNPEIRNNGFDNELPSLNPEESINVNIIHKGKPINSEVPPPRNPIDVQTKVSAVSRLNLGGIIALGVFGGIIILAAIIILIVLLIRRNRVKRKHDHHHHRGSPDNHTITSVDSGSDVGLGRLYRRAWDSLAATGGPPTGSTTINSTAKSIKGKDTLDFRSRLSSIEGMRDDGEIIVHDALPRKHHHHHHHHHNGHHHHHVPTEPPMGDWGRSVRSHRSRY